MTAMSPTVGGTHARIFVYCPPVDMRRSFDGLMAIVQADFTQDVCQAGRDGTQGMALRRKRRGG